VTPLSTGGKHFSLTRVTVPINYKDPHLARALGKKREELMKNGTPEKEISEELKEIIDTWTDKPASPYTVGFLGEALLSHSAQKIYLVDLSRRLNDVILSDLPDFLKRRIELADKDHKIYDSVCRMLSPINVEVDALWEKVRKETGALEHSVYGHEHACCLLGEFLTTLTIAVKYDTEADVDFNLTMQVINRIRSQVKSSESRTLLSRIEGILNCYKIPRQIPSIAPNVRIVPKDLLMDLLDEATIIALSQERYFLGVPSKIKIAMVRIKQKVREVLAVPKNRKYLAIASKVGNLATKQVNIELPEIETQQNKEFSPPFISLDSIKPNCLSTYRKISAIDPMKFR
jgi:hypothetical protein